MTLGRVDSLGRGLDWIALILLRVHASFKYKLQAMDKNAEIKKRREKNRKLFQIKMLGPFKSSNKWALYKSFTTIVQHSYSSALQIRGTMAKHDSEH